jgi:hypothetical protein
LIAKKIEKLEKTLEEYQKKRRNGSTAQETMTLSRNMSKMLEFIRYDLARIKEISTAEADPRIFKWNRNEDKILQQKEDLDLIEQHVQRISQLVAQKNDTDRKQVEKLIHRSTDVSLPTDLKVSDELKPLDITDSLKRLEKSKQEFHEHMSVFKDQLIELGHLNQEMREKMEISIEKNEQVELKLETQTEKVAEVNKQVDKANDESKHNFWRMIILGGLIVVGVILCIIFIIFLFKSGFF